MDFNFNVSGIMRLDVTKYKIHNDGQGCVYEWEHDGKFYSPVLGVEVFDPETDTYSYIVGHKNMLEHGFNIYDYQDAQWGFEKEGAEISKGLF